MDLQFHICKSAGAENYIYLFISSPFAGIVLIADFIFAEHFAITVWPGISDRALTLTSVGEMNPSSRSGSLSPRDCIYRPQSSSMVSFCVGEDGRHVANCKPWGELM